MKKLITDHALALLIFVAFFEIAILCGFISGSYSLQETLILSAKATVSLVAFVLISFLYYFFRDRIA